MRILIAEDDFTSRCLAAELLAAHGQVHVAVDGKEAIDAVAEAQAEGAPYTLICLDIGMPRLDGIEALNAIREMEEELELYPGPEAAKIVMMTADSDAKTVVGAFKDQCDAYIVKPITAEKLRKWLSELGVEEAA